MVKEATKRMTLEDTPKENNYRSGIINPTIITKLFKKCSISNDLDGMEDNVLWDE